MEVALKGDVWYSRRQGNWQCHQWEPLMGNALPSPSLKPVGNDITSPIQCPHRKQQRLFTCWWRINSSSDTSSSCRVHKTQQDCKQGNLCIKYRCKTLRWIETKTFIKPDSFILLLDLVTEANQTFLYWQSSQSDLIHQFMKQGVLWSQRVKHARQMPVETGNFYKSKQFPILFTEWPDEQLGDNIV